MADAPDEQTAADDIVEATKPPEVQEGTGIAMAGGYPVNHRLRAEALADAGKDKDPTGDVSPELIAETAKRLAAERKEAEAADDDAARAARELRAMKLADLRELAQAEGVQHEGDANKSAIVDAIEAARRAKNEG